MARKNIQSNGVVSTVLPLQAVGASLPRDLMRLLKLASTDHAAFISSGEKTLLNAVSCGRRLIAAKALVPHGDWEKKFDHQFAPVLGFQIRTAQRMMVLTRKFDECQASSQGKTSIKTDFNSSSQDQLKISIETGQKNKSKRKSKYVISKNVLEAILQLLGNIDTEISIDANSTFDQNSTDAFIEELELAGRVLIVLDAASKLSTWIKKASLAIDSGRATHVLILVPSTFKVQIFATISSSPFCLLQNPTTNKKSAGQPAMVLIYLANDPDLIQFHKSFAPLGNVFVPITNTTSGLADSNLPAVINADFDRKQNHV